MIFGSKNWCDFDYSITCLASWLDVHCQKVMAYILTFVAYSIQFDLIQFDSNGRKNFWLTISYPLLLSPELLIFTGDTLTACWQCEFLAPGWGDCLLDFCLNLISLLKSIFFTTSIKGPKSIFHFCPLGGLILGGLPSSLLWFCKILSIRGLAFLRNSIWSSSLVRVRASATSSLTAAKAPSYSDLLDCKTEMFSSWV